MVSVSQNSRHHQALMVQAPVRALDPDGVAVVTAGTAAFAVGAVVCWWLSPQLAASGRGWYFGVSVAGTLIGLLGLSFGLYRRARRRRGQVDAELETGGEPASVEQTDVNPDGVPHRE